MKNLKLEKNKNIYTITLQRPDVRNAFNDEMISEMTELFSSLQKDSQVRAVVLQGEGESFCAGGDLNWMKSMVGFSEKENQEDSEKLYEMFQALVEIPVPVVGLVHGHAMGGGLGLIACCDIVFAVDETQFCFSEVRLGLAPSVISSFVAKKILARDMHRYFLTAEVFNPEQAFAMGLIHGFGAKQDMLDSVLKVAKKISQNGPQAVRASKKLVNELTEQSDYKKRTTELIAKLRVSAEGQDGLNAFFEKRKPQWLES